MNKIIKEYREKHPNCEWCKWYKYNFNMYMLSMSSYEECQLKEKIIYCKKIKAKFCKYYEVKEEEDKN